MIVVISKSTKVDSDGETLSKIEIFKDDIAEDTIFTIPGFDSIPDENMKMLMQELAGGDKAVMLTPMKSDLKAGERRIFSTDGKGTVKGSILILQDGSIALDTDGKITLTLYVDGKIEIKATQGDMTALLSDAVTALKDLMTSLSTATVPTMLGPQLLSVAPDLITKLPAMILTAQNLALFKK